jgi:hypothetical protein
MPYIVNTKRPMRTLPRTIRKGQRIAAPVVRSPRWRRRAVKQAGRVYRDVADRNVEQATDAPRGRHGRPAPMTAP